MDVPAYFSGNISIDDTAKRANSIVTTRVAMALL